MLKHDNNVCACSVSALAYTSRRKSVTGNEFSDIDFLYDVQRFPVQYAFRLFCRFFTEVHKYWHES